MTKNILLLLIAPVLAATGQTLLKIGTTKASNLNFSSFKEIFNSFMKLMFVPEFTIAIPIYVVSFILWVYLLSRNDLSFAYPFLSLAYVIVFIFSWVFLSEDISFMRWTGAFLITLGVCIIGMSK